MLASLDLKRVAALLILVSTICSAADVDQVLKIRQDLPLVSSEIPSQISSLSSTRPNPSSATSTALIKAVPTTTSFSSSRSTFSSISSSTSSSSSSSSSLSSSLPSTSSTLFTTSTAGPTTATTTRSSTPPVSTQSTTSLLVVTTFITESGKTRSSIVTPSTIAPVSSAPVPTTSAAPSLNSNGDSGNSGLSSSSKRTIIGVVVGVGGAILLGGLALVAWRFRSRRRQQHDDGDDLVGAGFTGVEKQNSLNHGSPFKSTLDQYHGPTQVNTASNF